MNNPFPMYVRRFGRDVIIIFRSPQIDANGKFNRTKKGSIIYDETEIDTRCIIKTTGSNKGLWNDATQTTYDAKALFLLSEEENLNEDSVLCEADKSSCYQMQPPIKKHTHWEVLLKDKVI